MRSFVNPSRGGLHIHMRLGSRRHFALIIGSRVQTIALWRERPFPRAPQWQCELTHVGQPLSWRVWPRPQRTSEEREYAGAWLAWNEIRWGTWAVRWGYELPPARREPQLRSAAA